MNIERSDFDRSEEFAQKGAKTGKKQTIPSLLIEMSVSLSKNKIEIPINRVKIIGVLEKSSFEQFKDAYKQKQRAF